MRLWLWFAVLLATVSIGVSTTTTTAASSYAGDLSAVVRVDGQLCDLGHAALAQSIDVQERSVPRLLAIPHAATTPTPRSVATNTCENADLNWPHFGGVAGAAFAWATNAIWTGTRAVLVDCAAAQIAPAVTLTPSRVRSFDVFANERPSP
jgi:hypothetical protein